MRKLIVVISILHLSFGYTQAEHSLFFQDQFNGGVCFSAYGFGYSGDTIGSSQMYVEPGSTIRKAYLFYGVQIYQTGIYDLQNPFEIEINGSTILIDTANALFNNEKYMSIGGGEWTNYYLYAVDITDLIQPSDVQITYKIPSQPAGNNRYKFFCSYVLYENPSLPVINPCIYLNEEKMWVPMIYNLKEHNPMDFGMPVSLSTLIDWSVCIEDGYNVFVNSDSIGQIGGNDNAAAGPQGAITSGHFYHQNNLIYGLDDDTPDIWMDSSDVLADISSHIINENNFELTFDYSAGYSSTFNYTFEDFPDGLSNGIWMMLINYSPTCNATMLDVSFTDTTICLGDSVTLQATGGAKYKWSPSTFLDCDTCANPVCTAEKTQWYTCTITTADTCSKTLPVLVKVNQPADITATLVLNDTCGMDVGYIGVANNGVSPFIYSLDGNSQSAASFYNVKGGNHNLSITDGNGCSFDTTFFVPSVNLVRAGFTADPLFGEAPVEVSFTDQSQFADTWVWYMDDDTLFDQNPVFTFDYPDAFTVMQIAYNVYPECADTAVSLIRVYKPITIHIPNVITPDGDQINDDFLIDINGAEYVQWEIVNRWGQTVNFGEYYISSEQQTLNLWNGKALYYDLDVSDGVYFYRIIVRSPAKVTTNYTGSVSVFQ